MITVILSFLTALPSILNGVNSFASKYFDTKAQMTAARLGADVAVVKAAMTAEGIEQQARVAGLAVIAGSKVLLLITLGFALPLIIYEWQCIVYDKIWMDGKHATDPLGGDLSSWANIIIVSLFGSGSSVTLMHMYLNRNKAGE